MKFRRLIFANLFRKKIRLILTIGSFAIALVLFMFLAVVKSAFSRGTEIAGADRLVITNRIGLIQTMPIAYRDKILTIQGVKAVTHNNWFGGVYVEEKNFFPQFAIDVENHRQVMSELVVPEDQWQNFVKDRQGAVVGARTAQRFGWKVGDRIPIKDSLYGTNSTWDFNLDGIYHSDKPGGDESQFWFQWKYFDERVPSFIKSQIGWYVLKLDSPDDAVRVAKAIDGKFANSSTETKTETESAFAAGFAKQFGNIEFLILTIGSVVFFTLRRPEGHWIYGSFCVVPGSCRIDGNRSRRRRARTYSRRWSHSRCGRGSQRLAAPIDSVEVDFGSRTGFRAPGWSRQRPAPGNWRDAHARRQRAEEGLTWRFPSSTIFEA